MVAGRKRRTYGEGTVYRKRPDYWQAQLRCDGERVTASGRTPDEARRNLAAKLQEREGGRLDRRSRPVDIELGAFLRGWIDDLRSTEALKPSAWYRYESIVRLYLIPGLGGRRLADLTKSDVATLIREAREGRISVVGGSATPRSITSMRCSAPRSTRPSSRSWSGATSPAWSGRRR